MTFFIFFARLYVRVDIFPPFGKHLHDRIISQVWTHNLALPRHIVIEAPVSSQKSERLCICMLGVSILPLSAILTLNFVTVLN